MSSGRVKPRACGHSRFVCSCTGALTGAVFRSPRGLRTAGVAGGVGAVAASALVLARANLSKSL